MVTHVGWGVFVGVSHDAIAWYCANSWVSCCSIVRKATSYTTDRRTDSQTDGRVCLVTLAWVSDKRNWHLCTISDLTELLMSAISLVVSLFLITACAVSDQHWESDSPPPTGQLYAKRARKIWCKNIHALMRDRGFCVSGHCDELD